MDIEERRNIILDLRDSKKYSWGKIGQELGLTRQRIFQIYHNSGNTTYHRTMLQIKRESPFCKWEIKCKGKILPTKDLVVHHIDFNEQNNRPDNVIVLCRWCHNFFHSIEQAKTISKDPKNAVQLRTCVFCKKEFKPIVRRQKFCSLECYSRKIKLPEIKKVCQKCKKIFVVNRRVYYKDKVKFCSTICYGKSKKIGKKLST